ncbi:MAG: hypothetical protein LBQ69_04220 [Treponema sp.]|nr:hypothetical protein [Treponema sp.]
MGFWKKKFHLMIFSLFGVAALFIWSCASTRYFAAVDGELERSNYAASVDLLEKNRSFLYTGRDAILYYLDKGMLCHYAGLYADSSQLLEAGERAIENAFTKSVSQEISTFLINDNARDYEGEDYEDIYLNAFNALNYHHRGDSEGAMVEIRRMTGKLEHLSFRYDTALSNLQKKALDDNLSQIPPNPNAPAKFNNSALARYLGMLFYRGAGLRDSARIDRDWLSAAFANAPAVYNHPVPSSLSGELEIPGGMARLNVLAFGGLSPVKKEAVLRISLPSDRWIKIALPEIANRNSEIHRVALVFESGGSYELELLENMDAVTKATFSERQQLVYLKTIIRAMLKGAGSSALSIAAKGTGGDSGAIMELFSIGAQVFAEASEKADVRASRFFPARAYVGGINLEPGSYSFQVKYYNRSGGEIASVSHNDMIVRENALNLVEAVCLK